MNQFDLYSLFQFYLFILSIGLVFYPLTAIFFNHFFDKGYALSKVFGVILISFLSWLLSSLHIWPFGFYSIWLTLVLLGILIRVFLFNKTGGLNLYLVNIKTILLEEGLFLIGLIFWSFIRSFEPSIHGLEKFMDYGFINSLLRTEYMPPKDLWYSPFTINYYYFGHFWSALLIKASAINPDIGYNLILATIFGLCLSVSFSLGANLLHLFNTDKQYYSSAGRRHILYAGFLAAFLVALGGNLHTIYAFFQSYTPAENPVPFWTLPIKFNFLDYWYPNATRFIPFTIHEFPIYSFVVADLHGHVLNIPFVLFFIGILIKIYHQTKEIDLIEKILLGLMLAIFLMTNVLDGPIYLLVLTLVLLFKNSNSVIKNLFLISLLMIFFSLPYFLSFKPFAAGIGVLCAPKFLTDIHKIGPFLFEENHCQTSPLWMLVILWGFFYAVLITFIFTVVGKRIFKLDQIVKLAKLDQLVLVLALAATILIIIPEFFYAKDIYPNHYRANTVFKFGYQAFIILGLVSSFMIVRLFTQGKSLLLKSLILVLFLLVAIYPYFAITSYYNSLKSPKGLDGFKYLEPLYPSDYQAIIWIRQNIKGQPVIAEAQGDSYTDFARVSANTGLPTILGWPVHEWLWRGSYDITVPRMNDLSTLYESENLEQTKEVLKRYQVKYVFIGDLERQKYPRLNAGKFNFLGKEVYRNGRTLIYQVVSSL